jgi:hypothetical protein
VFNYSSDCAYGSHKMRMLSLPDFLFIQNMNLDEGVFSVPEILDMGEYFYKPNSFVKYVIYSMISCINHDRYEYTLFDNEGDKALKVWPKNEREELQQLQWGLLNVDGP